jgi:hypothetical protein
LAAGPSLSSRDDEQWHAVGSFDDFGDDFAVEGDVTGQVLDKHRVPSRAPSRLRDNTVAFG